ncbi:class I SAM-dependent DNA methyltransferase [Nitrosomonas sp. Nm132]|uniref:type I restriction-modification system subunit M n=1 Tax=Nitrosomonas sp. Nm132 TaxID=1881053 RepID=UPI000884C1EC|nr:class I SAM-dependent DNA methyltransferase [Nitrosomonas sp. Nm132]SDI06494.1 type I restriction enzyme M protein [Nitrosomonas sp. Nm132]
MLAPHIKKKVDELWNRFWAAGLTNPLVAVEQITYLLFLKRLEDIDLKRQQRGFPSIYAGYESCKWSYIRQEKTNPSHLIDVVFPWLRELDKHFSSASADGTELASLNNRMTDAYFQLDPNKGKVLSDAIDAIDQLFARAGEGSAAQDIMGDTFEYLLSEMATAGKNGQFRTPRHLIRFMVELLDPEPGQRVIDPAAGTGGFLFSTQQYLMRKYSAQDNLVLEWDGTPHRTDGAAATPEQYTAIHNGANFVGLDNDRTMARIGWMNLVLHDVTDPHLLQGDSLSKREGKDQLKQLLESESYDFVLANPPFTGTVDSGDLEPDSLLFPRVGGGGKKKDDSITNKSELLFLWLMLDLLRVGGRCAVIIPEGVLFGNTDAHARLRRELLTEHVVEGVISLPGGVFQPYTGVKTSILIFRKETRRDDKQALNGAVAPRTEHIWFYEVEEDGYSKDAKRNPRPGQQNDLWDALEKFKAWLAHGREGAKVNEKTLLQPSYWPERWRQALLRDTAEELTPAGTAFAASPDTSMWDGQVWGIHELFPELPARPSDAETYVISSAQTALGELIVKRLAPLVGAAYQRDGNRSEEQTTKDWDKAIKTFEADFKRTAKECESFFEKEDSPALVIWKDLVKSQKVDFEMTQRALGHFHNGATYSINPSPVIPAFQPAQQLPDEAWRTGLFAIAREIAKLDGFDVTLRSLAIDQLTELKAAKHWVVPVRAWARNDEWQSEGGQFIGSHDADGLVRPAYVQAMLADGLYDDKGALKDGLLEPDCIEAREWNLSAGQYKPFDFTQLKSDKSVAELIGTLKTTEQDIIQGLDKLLAMVEGRE